MRAVVVEDEILIREGLYRLLSRMFPEIEISGVAGNGQEGLLCIEKYSPDLVITDIKMPGMDGLEMLSRVHAAGTFPKVIILTAYSEFTYAQQAVKLGVCDYIIKPVIVQEFVETIRKIQNLYEQEQKGTPVIRTLFYMYPDDPVCWEIEDEYFYGPDKLVAPVLYAGQTSRRVYLPEGTCWIMEETGREYEGGQYYEVEAPIDVIPVFHKK